MNRRTHTLSALAVVAVLSGCGGSGPGIIGQERPRIRIFNAVDNTASITVAYRDAYGNTLGTSVAAALAGTASQDMRIANTNATPVISSAGAAVFTGATNLYRINTIYSLYCGGIPGKYAALALNDVGGAGGTAADMDVRVAQVAANTSGNDVFIVPAVPGGASGAALFQSMQFGTVSTKLNTTSAIDGNGYVLTPVTTGTSYEVIVTNHNSTVPIATTTATLNATVFYTVVIYDNGAKTGVQILSDRH